MKVRYLLVSIIFVILVAMGMYASAVDDEFNLTAIIPAVVNNPDGTWTRTSDALPEVQKTERCTAEPGSENDGCQDVGYTVNGLVRLNTTGYNCTPLEDGKLYVTCDSIYDGNGDGICTSGESCIQFGIVGGSVVRKEHNSQDAWVDHDDSYFLPRAEVQA